MNYRQVYTARLAPKCKRRLVLALGAQLVAILGTAGAKVIILLAVRDRVVGSRRSALLSAEVVHVVGQVVGG